MTLASAEIQQTASAANAIAPGLAAAFFIAFAGMVLFMILPELKFDSHRGKIAIRFIIAALAGVGVLAGLFFGVRGIIRQPENKRIAETNISKVEDAYHVTGLEGWDGYTDASVQRVWLHLPDGRPSAGKLRIHDGQATLYVNNLEFEGTARR
jgi:hypothetical protein